MEDDSKQSGHSHHAPPSTSDLLASAKLVAGAAQATLRHDKAAVDKAKVADAAGDLLCAASHYAKLDNKQGIGQYVEKAETYLHQYQSSPSAHAPHHSTTTHSPAATKHAASEEDEKQSEGSGGFGDYLKMAQGFMNRN